MFGTAITELFTGQWIDVLLKNVTDNAILLLTIETGVMVVGRAFAGPVVHRPGTTGRFVNIRRAGGAWFIFTGAFLWQYAFCRSIDIWHGRMLFLANHDWICIGEPA